MKRFSLTGCLASLLLLLPYFTALALALLPSGSVFLFRALFVLSIGLIAYYFRSLLFPVPRGRVRVMLYGLGLLLLFIAGDAFIRRYASEPFGQWDAWSIWHPRIRDFSLSFLRGIEVSFFRSDWAHPDYAPMAALGVAGPVIFLGQWALPWLPAAMNFAYYVLMLAILLLALAAVLTQEWIVPLVVFLGAMLSPMLFLNATDQCADHYLALIFLLSFALLDEASSRGQLILAGFCAASLPLIKNEGMFLLLAPGMYLAWLWLRQHRSLRQCLYFLSGMLAPLTMFLIYKLTANRLQPYDTTMARIFELLLDPARHGAVLGRWLDAHIVLSLAFLPISWLMVRPRGRERAGLLAILLVFTIYHLVFVVTPADQKWHLDTAFTRITVVVYPAWGFLMLRALLPASLQRDHDSKATRDESPG